MSQTESEMTLSLSNFTMGGGGGAYILLGVILLCGLLGDEAQNKEASTVWVPGKEPGKGKSGEY